MPPMRPMVCTWRGGRAYSSGGSCHTECVAQPATMTIQRISRRFQRLLCIVRSYRSSPRVRFGGTASCAGSMRNSGISQLAKNAAPAAQSGKNTQDSAARERKQAAEGLEYGRDTPGQQGLLPALQGEQQRRHRSMRHGQPDRQEGKGASAARLKLDDEEERDADAREQGCEGQPQLPAPRRSRFLIHRTPAARGSRSVHPR